MRKKEAGFGAVEIVIILVVVALIGVGGWYVWQSNQPAQKTATPVSQAKSARDCKEDWHPKEQSFEYIPWLDVTSTTVDLCKWDATITLPADQVNKAVYKYHSENFAGTYYFSTHGVIDDPKCLAYYSKDEMEYGHPGTFEVTRFKGGELVTGPGKLEDYYRDNKAAAGNYAPESGLERYYKVGDYYFRVAMHQPELEAQRAATRKANCANEKPDFRVVFADAFKTLKEN